MAPPPAPANELTEPPVKLSKNTIRGGGRTLFLGKVSVRIVLSPLPFSPCASLNALLMPLHHPQKHIRGVKDGYTRRTQRHRFHKLMGDLINSDDGKEIPYRQPVAEKLRHWLNEAQKLWNMDLTTDLDSMLDGLEKTAEEYKMAKEEERDWIKQQEELADAEFVLLVADDEDLDSPWEMV